MVTISATRRRRRIVLSSVVILYSLVVSMSGLVYTEIVFFFSKIKHINIFFFEMAK